MENGWAMNDRGWTYNDNDDDDDDDDEDDDDDDDDDDDADADADAADDVDDNDAKDEGTTHQRRSSVSRLQVHLNLTFKRIDSSL